jgi:hypothetical protein
MANLGRICPDPVKAQQHDQRRETRIIRLGYFRMCCHFGFTFLLIPELLILEPPSAGRFT